MDFIRRHAFYIICGVTGLAGLALAALGLQAMPKVVTEMDKAKQVYQSLSSLQNRPASQDHIEAEEHRIEFTMEDRERVLTEARKYCKYEPLLPGVLPAGDENSRREFRKKYGKAMRQLLTSLRGGRRATSLDIDLMHDKIANEQARRKEKGLDAGAVPAEPEDLGPPRTPAGVLTKAGARTSAEARADIARAQSIYCYLLGPGEARPPTSCPSLDFHPAMLDTGIVDAPYYEEVWDAQVGYWIQKDVVDAIVALNDEAAAAAKTRDEDPWVGIMSVKDIVSVRVSEEYVPPEGELFAGAAAEGYDEALPPGTGESAFTETTSSRAFEVKHFTVKLVMDQRDILRLVDKLCTNSFYTLLRLAYRAVPPNREMQGKIYGSEPAVLVVMDFEAVMLGEVFRPMMPLEVCEALVEEGYEIECPEPEEEEPEEEG